VVGSNSTGTTIPSDGEYDSEPDGDGAEITIGAAAGTIGELGSESIIGAVVGANLAEITIGAASGSESTIGAVVGANLTRLINGTSVVGTNSTGLISGASIEATSVLGCLVLAVSNMATFFLEGNFYNGELPPVKLRPLRGTRILSNNRRTLTGVNVGSDAHTCNELHLC
jgi:hypothetical protein